jgi:glycosyltransferase involved in cell wall biosynthesis
MNNYSMKKIIVDLTPIVAGGFNGGAKIFVIELLKQLAIIAPNTMFVLLTQLDSYDELALLEKKNMSRMLITKDGASGLFRRLIRILASKFLTYVPNFFKNIVTLWGGYLILALKRSATKTLMKKLGGDLLFCPFTAPTFYLVGMPVVCIIYDLQHKEYPDFFSIEEIAYRDFTFMDACKKSNFLVAISNFSRDKAISFGKLQTTKIKTIYIRTAMRFGLSTSENIYFFSNLGIKPKRFLLYPANFWKHKNHEILISAFKLASQMTLDEDIKLICTGSPGDRKDDLVAMSSKAGMSNRILFPGYLSNDELHSLINNSLGLIFPSLYEGFGMPIMEAMAAGVPVACSNISSLPEIALDSAILFDPHDSVQVAEAIVALVSNDKLRSKLISSGLERAAEFSDVRKMAVEYLMVFEHLFAQKTSTGNL